jgi:hypothetical protein
MGPNNFGHLLKFLILLVILMAKSFLSPPSLWYWLIATIPILSFGGSAFIAYFFWVRGPFIPVPFTVAGHESACYYFEVVSFVSIICLLIATWRTFRSLSRSHGSSRKGPSTNQIIAIYAVSLVGLIGIGLYGAFVFIVEQRGSLEIKAILHIGSLLVLTIYLIGSNAIVASVNRLKVILPRWIYHLVALLLVIAYGVSVTLSWRSVTPGFVIFAAVMGYLAIAVVFAGFPIHAHLLFGAGFVIPFVRAKKV